MSNIVILEGARTAFANINHSFKKVSATDLGVFASKGAIERAKISPQEIDHVIFGNVQQSDKNGHMLARHIGLKSGVNIDVPALTVNRLCGTGIEVITLAAKFLSTGDEEVILVGGTENMSQVPHVIPGMRWGSPLGGPKIEDWLWEGLLDTFGGCTMAETAENLAKKYGITRDEVDQYALLSYNRAIKARDKGYLKEEIVPVEVKTSKGTVSVDQDEHIRDTTIEQLNKLKPRFIKDGVVTAGNASGMVDGAAAMIVAKEEYALRNNLDPIARVVAWDVVGVDPKYMGIGPVPAIKNTLKKANLKLADVDLIEINEAFSAQYLACEKQLGYNPSIANVNGGAIALGHPLAASGTRITYSLIKELQRRGKKYGVASACIGGGQGIAILIEVY